jgi:hypothetical protein
MNDSIKLKRLITLRQTQELLFKHNMAVSIPAVIKWVKDISMQPAGKGGKIYVDREALLLKIKGGWHGKDNEKRDKECCKSDCEKKPEGCGGRNKGNKSC